MLDTSPVTAHSAALIPRYKHFITSKGWILAPVGSGRVGSDGREDQKSSQNMSTYLLRCAKVWHFSPRYQKHTLVI